MFNGFTPTGNERIFHCDISDRYITGVLHLDNVFDHITQFSLRFPGNFTVFISRLTDHSGLGNLKFRIRVNGRNGFRNRFRINRIPLRVSTGNSCCIDYKSRIHICLRNGVFIGNRLRIVRFKHEGLPVTFRSFSIHQNRGSR